MINKDNRGKAMDGRISKNKEIALYNLTDYEIMNIDDVDRHKPYILDPSKVECLIYRSYTKEQREKHGGCKGRIIFRGQDNCNYDTKMDMYMFFEDVFIKHYEDIPTINLRALNQMKMIQKITNNAGKTLDKA